VFFGVLRVMTKAVYPAPPNILAFRWFASRPFCLFFFCLFLLFPLSLSRHHQSLPIPFDDSL